MRGTHPLCPLNPNTGDHWPPSAASSLSEQAAPLTTSLVSLAHGTHAWPLSVSSGPASGDAAWPIMVSLQEESYKQYNARILAKSDACQTSALGAVPSSMGDAPLSLWTPLLGSGVLHGGPATCHQGPVMASAPGSPAISITSTTAFQQAKCLVDKRDTALAGAPQSSLDGSLGLSASVPFISSPKYPAAFAAAHLPPQHSHWAFVAAYAIAIVMCPLLYLPTPLR